MKKIHVVFSRVLAMVVGAGMVSTAAAQSVVINEYRNQTPDVAELVVIQDGLNMQGMILKDYSSSGVNDGGGAYTFSSDSLWASVPAGTIIVLRKDNSAADVTVGGSDYNLDVGLLNTTYFTAGSGTFDVATEEILQIKASGSGQAGSTGAIHTFATAGAGAQYDGAPTPKLKASTGNTGTGESVEAGNGTSALADFNGTDAAGDDLTGSIGTYNNANNQTYIDSLRGPLTFGVTFNKTSGFAVEQGSSDAVVATAANGTAPYSYSWSSTLDGAHYSADTNVFTILATAPIGDYSAQVVATDSDAPAKSVTNSLNFSVVAAATQYAIAIVTNNPGEGTVTTAPAGQATNGATVTVNAAPAGGYAVQSIAVVDDAMNPVTVTGSTFTMPAADVTVTVTFVVHVGSDLIISEVVDPSDDANGRYVEIYNAGAAPIDLAAGQWYLARQANGTTWANIALTGTVGAAQAYVVAYSATSFPVAYPTAPTPNQYNGNITGNGDDGYFLYSGGNQSAGILEDSYGVLNQDGTTNAWEYTDGRAVRNADVTAGNPTWTALEWTITRPAGVAAMTPGVHPDGAAVFGVTFNKASGFTVEQGTSDSVVATAANGVAPYSYSWTSTLGEGYRTADTNVFTILATAPIGDYSAEVVATDSDAPAKSVTNSLNFSVVAPPTKYAIAIVTNNPGEGTVTTTPATEAAEGVAVTINITPADGYRAASVAVNGGAVAVVGNAFTMPAEPVTVTVTFEVYDAPDVLIDFETNTTLSGSAYTAGTSLVNNVSFAHQRVLRGSLANDRVHGTYAGRFYPQGGTNGLLATTAAFAEPISKISFWHANYGTDNGTTFKVQVSPDGAAWEDVGAVIDPESTTLTEVVLESVPANATYIQFVTVAGTARVNVDDIGLWFGEPVFGVSVNKANGFTVNEGSSDTITATAANGTPPYAYSWSSTLGGAHYATNANVFTILATAPTGSYSATVTATDATNATAQKTVTFSVVGLAPGQPAVLISGNLSGTVGVQMDLSITVTNETANDWLITLKDPDGLDDYSYGFVPPAFTLTPTKSGTYVLTAEAQTGSGNFSNRVNLAVSGGGGDVWQIGNAGDGGSMFYALTNITIVLPTNYTLYAVYGSDTTAGGINGWPWPLVPASNYTWNPGTRTLTLPTSVTNRRIYRIGATP